jgi:transposase
VTLVLRDRKLDRFRSVACGSFEARDGKSYSTSIADSIIGSRLTLGDRFFIEAVLFRAKTGLPCRDLPERFGPRKTVHNRFCDWARKGIARPYSRNPSSKLTRPARLSMAPSFVRTKTHRAEKGGGNAAASDRHVRL